MVEGGTRVASRNGSSLGSFAARRATAFPRRSSTPRNELVECRSRSPGVIASWSWRVVAGVAIGVWPRNLGVFEAYERKEN